jgi:hypothetical protein
MARRKLMTDEEIREWAKRETLRARTTPKCPCGSNKPPRGLFDASGLYIQRACDDCERRILKGKH